MAISIIDNFKVGAPKPIDVRLVVNSGDDKDLMQNKYEGLRIWDLNDNKPYVWVSESWQPESSGSSVSIPVGGIIMWSDDELPFGFVLCDGCSYITSLTDGFIQTPNLQQKFIFGAGNDQGVFSPGSISVGDEGTFGEVGNNVTYYGINFIMYVGSPIIQKLCITDNLDGPIKGTTTTSTTTEAPTTTTTQEPCDLKVEITLSDNDLPKETQKGWILLNLEILSSSQSNGFRIYVDDEFLIYVTNDEIKNGYDFAVPTETKTIIIELAEGDCDRHRETVDVTELIEKVTTTTSTTSTTTTTTTTSTTTTTQEPCVLEIEVEPTKLSDGGSVPDGQVSLNVTASKSADDAESFIIYYDDNIFAAEVTPEQIKLGYDIIVPSDAYNIRVEIRGGRCDSFSENIDTRDIISSIKETETTTTTKEPETTTTTKEPETTTTTSTTTKEPETTTTTSTTTKEPETTTTTSTTTKEPETTTTKEPETTTTKDPGDKTISLYLGDAMGDDKNRCGLVKNLYYTVDFNSSNSAITGNRIYEDVEISSPFNGLNAWYDAGDVNGSNASIKFQINTKGEIINISLCE